jgi:hypothetical protein
MCSGNMGNEFGIAGFPKSNSDCGSSWRYRRVFKREKWVREAKLKSSLIPFGSAMVKR